MCGCWSLGGQNAAESWPVTGRHGRLSPFFLVVHVADVVVDRSALGLDTNFYFAAAGFHVWPFGLFFGPYYFLAVITLFTHLGCAAYWRTQSQRRIVHVATVLLPVGLGSVASLLIGLLDGGCACKI